MGNLLQWTGDHKSAILAFEAALAIQNRLMREHPFNINYVDSLATTYNNLGTVLHLSGNRSEARKALDSALEILESANRANPSVVSVSRMRAGTHVNRGILLQVMTDLGSARQDYDAAVKILEPLVREHPNTPEYTFDLARALLNRGTLLQLTRSIDARSSLESAFALWRKLAQQHPESPDNASGLGASLHNLAILDFADERLEDADKRSLEALAWQRKALEPNPTHPMYLALLKRNLALRIMVCSRMNNSDGAAEARRQLAELDATSPTNPGLDARLTAVLRGDQPSDQTERIKLAYLAYERKLYGASASLFAKALETEATLIDDRRAQHCYNAACAAALAGCGHGEDNSPPDETTRDKLRGQALAWLEAELTIWSKQLESASDNQRAAIVKTLQWWKQDPDLAGVRDAEALAKLPESERIGWETLWANLDTLIDDKVLTDPDTVFPVDPFVGIR
jgi:tetratricopeptide (TPR) repeat protein